MALIQVNYLSKALFRTVPLQVILPVDKISFETMDYSVDKDCKFKTLYLLHGLLGNYTDWVSGTRIQRWAEEKNLAVVMPSGDNSFYVNGITPNNDYGEFIGKELVEITRKMFPLSDKREDTFIAGLSSALQILEVNADNVAGEHLVFGNADEARKTDKNPRVALENMLKENKPLPEIYMACGLSDSLLEMNRTYRDLFIENGMHVTYEEETGGHEWDFWDRQIRKVLEWLPLEEEKHSLGSGSVKKEQE